MKMSDDEERIDEQELEEFSQKIAEIDFRVMSNVLAYLYDIATQVVSYADFVVRRECQGGIPMNIDVKREFDKRSLRVILEFSIPDYIIEAITESEEILELINKRIEKRKIRE